MLIINRTLSLVNVGIVIVNAIIIVPGLNES